MNFSSQTLLKLQRLARVVKKELHLSVHIADKEGIGDLLRRAASEAHSVATFEAHSNFMSTLTEQDKAELISYNVSITPESNSLATEVAPRQEEPKPDRRQKERHYRGALVTNERRTKQDPLQGEDRRTQERRKQGNNTKQQKPTGQHTYRGVDIEEIPILHNKPKKKKSPRMYRGQSIYDDDE